MTETAGVLFRTSWKLKQVSKNKDNTFALTYDTPEGQKQIKTRAVALTVPAYIAADLLQSNCTGAADKLRGFDYPPVAAISLAYPMSSIRDDRKNKEGEVPGERNNTNQQDMKIVSPTTMQVNLSRAFNMAQLVVQQQTILGHVSSVVCCELAAASIPQVHHMSTAS